MGKCWEPWPVGKTKEAQERNTRLLGDYDHEAYLEYLTGFTGQDRQRIFYHGWRDAVRVRVGTRRNFKPGMALLPDGTLVIAVFRWRLDSLGAGSPAERYEIRLYRSRDQGLTWEEIRTLPMSVKEPSLTALPDGSLVLTVQDPMHPMEMPVSRSEDGGETWETVMIPSGSGSYPRNLVVEPDGSLLMVQSFEWRGDNPNLRVGRSSDGGRTWTFSEGRLDWDRTDFGEVATIRLKDGRLLAALRRQQPETWGEGFQDTVMTESRDDGRTWEKPWRMSNTAEVHAYLTELDDGRILATYANYHLPWGVYAVVSEDGGRTWDLDDPVQLGLSADLNVGWPVTLQLPDGGLVTAYGATTHMRPEYVAGHFDDWSPEKLSCEVVCWRLPRVECSG